MFEYKQIAEVNKGIKYTPVKGKNYAEVAQRVQAFRKLVPCGYITTDILKIENGIVYMKAEAGYYTADGNRVMLGTGLAFERQDASNINKTSFIENCETSAVGRALGFIGLGSESSIASSEEVANAIATQEAIEKGTIADPVRPKEPAKPAKVDNVPSVPQKALETPVNPVLEYLAKERDCLREARKISKAENAALWKKQIEVMTAAGMIPNKKLSEFTRQEAESMIAYMYTKFAPTGAELKTDEGKTA